MEVLAGADRFEQQREVLHNAEEVGVPAGAEEKCVADTAPQRKVFGSTVVVSSNGASERVLAGRGPAVPADSAAGAAEAGRWKSDDVIVLVIAVVVAAVDVAPQYPGQHVGARDPAADQKVHQEGVLPEEVCDVTPADGAEDVVAFGVVGVLLFGLVWIFWNEKIQSEGHWECRCEHDAE